MNGMRPPEPDPQGRPVPDPVGEARRGERAALELVRSGQLDADTRRELQIAIDQLRADLVNGENPEASLLYRIPEPLIRAVIKTESDYDPRVVSSVGARGLMQLMPAAQSDMGVTNVHDPRENILGGTRYLRILANRFNGDLVLTIAAYHCGAGAVSKYGNSVPPYKNTRKYLRMVLDRYYRYRDRAN